MNIRKMPSDPDEVCVNCGNPECAWAHLRYRDSGMGMKCPDIFGAPLCKQCHDYIDGRAKFDAFGHRHPEGPEKDFEFKYRCLRAGIRRLVERGIIHV